MEREKYSDSWTQIAVLQTAFIPIIIVTGLFLNGAGSLLIIMWALSAIALIPTVVCMHKLCYVTADNRGDKVTPGVKRLLWLGRFLALTELAGLIALLVY